MPTTTGRPEEYLERLAGEVVGWAAVYWDGTGRIRVFSPLPAVEGWERADPAELPGEGLQVYLVFGAEDRHLYTLRLQGFDEYHFVGREGVVLGKFLTDAQWEFLTELVTRDVWGRRGLFAPRDWGVPS